MNICLLLSQLTLTVSLCLTLAYAVCVCVSMFTANILNDNNDLFRRFTNMPKIKMLFSLKPNQLEILWFRVKNWGEKSEAGATFNNSFFDNSFIFLRQFKNRSFLDPVFVFLVEVRINRSKTGQHLTSINSDFDFSTFGLG